MEHTEGLTPTDCGCEIMQDYIGGSGQYIMYCPLHAAAPELLELAKLALDIQRGTAGVGRPSYQAWLESSIAKATGAGQETTEGICL